MPLAADDEELRATELEKCNRSSCLAAGGPLSLLGPALFGALFGVLYLGALLVYILNAENSCSRWLSLYLLILSRGIALIFIAFPFVPHIHNREAFSCFLCSKHCKRRVIFGEENIIIGGVSWGARVLTNYFQCLWILFLALLTEEITVLWVMGYGAELFVYPGLFGIFG